MIKNTDRKLVFFIIIKLSEKYNNILDNVFLKKYNKSTFNFQNNMKIQ
ncbi:hypothetical protein Llab_1563 [Lactococcus lactis]|nr:hypothetical protein Llab_1563 [Lactococcus lactis]